MVGMVWLTRLAALHRIIGQGAACCGAFLFGEAMGTRQHAAGRHAKAKFASMLQRLMVVVERQLRQLEAVDDAGLGGKSAIDQASLIVRTAEKIDSLQRMLLAEAEAARRDHEAELLDEAGEEALARKIATRIDEQTERRMRALLEDRVDADDARLGDDGDEPDGTPAP
jgi:hypothetical protein